RGPLLRSGQLTGTAGSWRAPTLFSAHWGHEPDLIRTAGSPRPQRPRKGEDAGDFPRVQARATRCDRGPVAVRYFAGQLTGTAGSWRAPTLFQRALGP